MVRYAMRAKVWLYPGMAGWHFVTVPKRHAEKIKAQRWGVRLRGFGSIRVHVTVGSTRWQTSIFPEKASGSYVLPIKAAVRKAEDVAAGDTIRFELEVP
jgi:hypothetical protein